MAETNNLDDLPRGLQIDTTTYNPIPEDALPNEIENVAKIMLGPGSAGLGEPEDGTMKGYQFFRDQYLPEKVKQLSENFGYSEDEIYGMINTRLREYVGSPGKPKMAKGGQVKRVGLRGGKDAAQSDFSPGPGEVGSDAGFDNTSKSQVTEINIPDAPTVFDINKVGDPSQNPKSINVGGGINYTPSFAPKPNFVQKAITKGTNFVKFVSPFLVNAAFGTFVPSKIKKGLALINLANNLDVIADKTMEDTLEEEMAVSPDGRTEFKGGGIKKIPIRSNKYGVKELDYRKSGGFVPIGIKEKADDVPAMLSKNEFVFTADAVRGAGGGSINKGAQRMYNLMKNLEARKA